MKKNKRVFIVFTIVILTALIAVVVKQSSNKIKNMEIGKTLQKNKSSVQNSLVNNLAENQLSPHLKKQFKQCVQEVKLKAGAKIEHLLPGLKESKLLKKNIHLSLNKKQNIILSFDEYGNVSLLKEEKNSLPEKIERYNQFSDQDTMGQTLVKIHQHKDQIVYSNSHERFLYEDNSVLDLHSENNKINMIEFISRVKTFSCVINQLNVARCQCL